MNDLHRVFFHELGHFVSHEINKLKYHGTGTKSIIIYSFGHNDPRFVGDAKISLTEGEKEKDCPSIDLLPEYLASCTYGCIFQAYRTNGSLDDCFKMNGQKDAEQWYWALRTHRLDDHKSEVTSIEKEFFAKLVNEKLLDNFTSLDPDKYLDKVDSTNYAVNIALLREDTKEIIKEHVAVYKELVEQIKVVIDKYQSPEHH